MKILHINKFFDLAGGAETYLHALMREQSAAGHDVHVLATRSPKNLPSPDASRFVTRYDYSRSEGMRRDARKAVNFMWNREARAATAQAIRELSPDVIHLHNLYHHLSSSVLAPIRSSRTPCVQTLHDLKLACPNYRMFTEGSPCERCKGGRYLNAVTHHCLSSGFLPNVLAALEMGMTKARQSYERTVQTFICPSQFMRTRMQEWGEPAAKLRVVPMPVVLPERLASRDGGYFLAVGRLSPEKGYDLLIRAMKHVPDARLKIAGIGPEEDRLKSIMTAEGIHNVELVGFKRGDELSQLYVRAAAYVASPVGNENAPLAVLDALALGLPVIATDIGGLPEMVKDGVNGFLVDRGNVDAWVMALKRFLRLSASEAHEMARASRGIAEKDYPRWSGHAERISEVYENAKTLVG